MNTQIIPQLPAEAGIVQTISLLRALVNQVKDHPLIVEQARLATRGAVGMAAIAAALDHWTRERMFYKADKLGLEEITNPLELARQIAHGARPGGDCDDMVGYAAALARALGYHPVFEVVGHGLVFHHIYLTLGGYRIDPTVAPDKPPFFANRRLRMVV